MLDLVDVEVTSSWKSDDACQQVFSTGGQSAIDKIRTEIENDRGDDLFHAHENLGLYQREPHGITFR